MVTERLVRFCEREGIELLLLFGSRAKDTASPGRDWDVGVLKREGFVEPEKYMDFTYRLAQALGGGNLDVVDLRPAPPPSGEG